MTKDSVSFSSWRMTSTSLSPFPQLFPPSSWPPKYMPALLTGPVFTPDGAIFSPHLTPPSGSPISTPIPLYFPVACSPGLLSIHQAFLHVLTLCCYLRATRLGNCSQEADFLDLIFHCYVMIRQQHQDAFRKCWLCVVPCGRQNTLSDPFCKNLVGQIRSRHVES